MLSVSDTAWSIAQIRADEALLPESERIFVDPYAPIFAAAGAHAAEGTARFLSLPFFRDGIRLRTRAIDDVTRDALSAGITQIVLLGAGLDARGMRLPEIAAHCATVFEVDFAELLDTKRALLTAAGVSIPAHVSYVACDLASPDLDAALLAPLVAKGFRPHEGALFIWEGVVSYLDRASIDRSLALMARAGGVGTRVVFDYGAFYFDAESGEDCVRRAGFDRFEEVAYDALWRRYLPGDAHENAWVCRLGVASVSPRA
ncbi:MAG: class I SAM-dependent methyltransferase [Polyangiales bacterium]